MSITKEQFKKLSLGQVIFYREDGDDEKIWLRVNQNIVEDGWINCYRYDTYEDAKKGGTASAVDLNWEFNLDSNDDLMGLYLYNPVPKRKWKESDRKDAAKQVRALVEKLNKAIEVATEREVDVEIDYQATDSEHGEVFNKILIHMTYQPPTPQIKEY